MSVASAETFTARDPRKMQRRIILFCAILMTGGNLLIPREPLALLILALGAFYFGTFSTTLNRRKIIVYVWLAVVMIFAFIRFESVDIMANVTRLLNFAIGLVLLGLYWGDQSSKLKSDLRVLIFPMVYQAIATVLIAAVFPALFVLVQVGTMRFYTVLGVLNYHVMVEGLSPLARPNGFFFEPGVFQIYLNILMFVLFIEQARWRHVLLTLLAVLLTQSTTGILIAALQLSYFSVILIFRRGITVRKIATLAVIVMISPAVYHVAAQNIESKLTGGMAGSASARSYDLESGLRIINEHPILGIGFNHSAYMEYSLRLNSDTDFLAEVNRDGRASTSGLMIVIYSIGLPLGLLYLAAILNQKFLPHRLMFAAILLTSLASEPLSFTPLFIVFAFSGLCLKARQRSTADVTSSGAVPHATCN